MNVPPALAEVMRRRAVRERVYAEILEAARRPRRWRFWSRRR